MRNRKRFTFPSLYEIRKRRLERSIKYHKMNKEYYELKEEVDAYKKLSKQGKFSKRTIIFCLLFISIYALLCLYVQYKNSVDSSGLLKIVAAVFGGELMMLLFKRIFSTEDKKISSFIDKFKKNKKEDIVEDEPFNDNSEEEFDDDLSSMVEEINNSIDGGGLG